jgi:uncharacterized membrane protein
MLALTKLMKNPAVTFLSGVGAMYLLDPHRGRRRRAMARDRSVKLMHTTTRALDKSLRDLANRAQGLVYESVSKVLPDHVSDVVLVDRVRAKMGRVVSHPGAIVVTAQDGHVTLAGDVLEDEVHRLMECVGSISGARSVTNKLTAHQDATGIPALQGGGRQPVGQQFELLRPRWAPATRLLVSAAGFMLASGGARRRGVLGFGMGMLGTSLMVRGLTNFEFGELVGAAGERGITLQKTAHIHAPVERVFELLANPEKFPHIMEHVQEVKKVGDGRYHWTVSGPGGATVSWDAEITKLVPNKLLAWRSTPDATVKNAGVMHFDPDANGGTRVHIEMSYIPPGGAIGHVIAELLAADPKHAMDDDLARVKSLMEHGKTRAHHVPVKLDELAG